MNNDFVDISCVSYMIFLLVTKRILDIKLKCEMIEQNSSWDYLYRADVREIE
jgi:hypothetical protein